MPQLVFGVLRLCRRAVFIALRALWRAARELLPRFVRRSVEVSGAALRLRHAVGPSKYAAELGYWRDRHAAEGGNLRKDAYYRDLITRTARFGDESPFRDKVVIDIGCGPRGSLCWIPDARLRVGIDPLADAYRGLGIAGQPMWYVGACGEALPLADGVADVIVTINAMDHVDDVAEVMSEIRRVLKPGGTFIGSICLREVPTATEPSVITRQRVHADLLAGWVVEHEHVFPECDIPGDAYRYADKDPPADYRADAWILWCRATRPKADQAAPNCDSR